MIGYRRWLPDRQNDSSAWLNRKKSGEKRLFYLRTTIAILGIFSIAANTGIRLGRGSGFWDYSGILHFPPFFLRRINLLK